MKEKVRLTRKERRKLKLQQIKEKKHKKVRFFEKSNFWIIVAVAVIFVGLIGWGVWANLDISFTDAVKDTQLRDKYIEKIVKEIGKPDYITVVNYVDTPEELEFLKKEYNFVPIPNPLMAAHHHPVPLTQDRKTETPIRISVFPRAFDEKALKIEEDFISSILHEYRHAEIFQKGKFEGKFGATIMFSAFLTKTGKPNGILLNDVEELDAIRIELAMPKISEEYHKDRMNLFLRFYTQMWDHSEEMNPEFIKFLKIEFFENWMLKSPNLIKEKHNSKEIWYFQHPITGKKYYLPEEIIRRFSLSDKGQKPLFLFYYFN